jgi:hypothetical protein
MQLEKVCESYSSDGKPKQNIPYSRVIIALVPKITLVVTNRTAIAPAFQGFFLPIARFRPGGRSALFSEDPPSPLHNTTLFQNHTVSTPSNELNCHLHSSQEHHEHAS